METTNFTEKESIEIIRNMIRTSRQNISHNAVQYLMWGWLVIIASLGHYLVWKFTDFQHPYIFWAILMPLGGILSIIIARKQGQTAMATTIIDKAMTYIWAGFAGPGVITIIIGFVMGWEIIYPVFIAIYGWGSLISGGLLKFRPLVWGGLFCFVLGIAVIFVGPMEKLLFIALAVTASHLIPGYLLKKNKHQ